MADYEKNNEKKERGRITFNGRLYPNLHKLAELVYQKMAVDYQKMMDKWMMGTGGGPGAPANFAI